MGGPVITVNTGRSDAAEPDTDKRLPDGTLTPRHSLEAVFLPGLRFFPELGRNSKLRAKVPVISFAH